MQISDAMDALPPEDRATPALPDPSTVRSSDSQRSHVVHGEEQMPVHSFLHTHAPAHPPAHPPMQLPSQFETPAAGLLRIDRSVLPPLEHFLPDDGAPAKSPEELLKAGEDVEGAEEGAVPRGQAPFFKDDEWEWRGCDVLSYNQESEVGACA